MIAMMKMDTGAEKGRGAGSDGRSIFYARKSLPSPISFIACNSNKEISYIPFTV